MGTVVLIVLLPFMALAQDSDASKGHGYVFFAPGVTSPGGTGTAHIGGGGEGFFTRNLGLGVDFGYLTAMRSFGDGIGAFSPNFAARFQPKSGDGNVEPFVTGGHTLFFRGEAANGAKSGSSVRGLVRATVGGAMQYLDEPWHLTGGGSLRLYVFKRLSVEPEFMVAPGPRFKQWTFVPNVALDLADRGNRVTPYVIGGIGYFHELDKSINYERSEMAWNGGIGVRVRLVGRMFVSPELRVGHISRVAVGVGCIF